MSNLVSITFIASPSSAPQTRYVEGERTVEEYLTEVEGVSSFSNITVEVDGSQADLGEEITDGMVISIAQKKTDSGSN